MGILLLDEGLAAVGNEKQWAEHFEGRLMVIAEEGQADGQFLVPRGWPGNYTRKALQAAIREARLLQNRHYLMAELHNERDKSLQLTNIGTALSAQTDINHLLTMILREGRNLACCDAGSLYLIDREDENQAEMIFKLTQCDSLSFPFEEKRMPMNEESISGVVALTGKSLNIADVYLLPQGTSYGFNSYFDESRGYRSRSMLTLPMKNRHQEVIGVLQFINRKTSQDIKLTSTQAALDHTIPFDTNLEGLLKALASQAAVAIENSLLISRINHLFEGFVNASVTAIEQRDPTTSGHSFRVAELTTNLALSLPRSGCPLYGNAKLRDEEIRELRYASLLHDFGKVGVRERVLVKEKKLPKNGLELIWHRFAIYQEQLRRSDRDRRLEYILKHGREAYAKMAPEFNLRLEDDLSRFTDFYKSIEQANNPTILPEGHFSHLEQILELPRFESEGRPLSLLTETEFLALSVRKGSLTPLERKEIESHVVHTFDFLERIPWTPGLRNVPAIAGAHHEKLDGSGYPHRLNADQIPLPSKMMTISDIYDALTASDRPYKKAMPTDRALSILEDEAGKGLLDKNLVHIFIEADIYKESTYTVKDNWKYPGFDERFFRRNVCDYDLPTN